MGERQCIWCRFGEPKVSFHNEAHIVPQSLGGERLCDNVCDSCNSFFGSRGKGVLSIEEAIKETFGISRMMILHQQNKMGKNKPGKRFTSRLFNVDLVKRSLSTKPSWRLHRGFQQDLSRLFRRGIYKMFLEALEADSGKALDPKYDFVREFARYDYGNYPVFYFPRRFGVIPLVQEHIDSPQLHISRYRSKYLLSTESFIEFEFLGHVFGIPTSRHSHLIADNYFEQTHAVKKALFSGVVLVKFFNDVDLSMNSLKEAEGAYERWQTSTYGSRLRRF